MFHLRQDYSRHFPCVGEGVVGCQEAFTRGFAESRAPEPERDHICLLNSLNDTSAEDPCLYRRTAFITKVRREENGTTG